MRVERWVRISGIWTLDTPSNLLLTKTSILTKSREIRRWGTGILLVPHWGYHGTAKGLIKWHIYTVETRIIHIIFVWGEKKILSCVEFSLSITQDLQRILGLTFKYLWHKILYHVYFL